MRTLGTIISFTYMERLRSKGFLWTTLITVVLIGLLLWIPKLVSQFSSGDKGTVLVADPLRLVSGAEELSKGVSADYRWELLSGDNRDAALDRLSREDEVKGVVTLGEAGGMPVLDIAVRKKDDLPIVEELTRFARQQLTLRQMDELSLTQRQKEQLTAPPEVKLQELTAGAKSKETTLAPIYFMILLLYFMIISYGGSVASSVAVEKGSRIKEVLITKVRPVQLLFGKVIGVGLAGLTQFLLIVLGAALWFLLSGGQAVRIGGLALDLSAVSGVTLFYFVLFFLLGYFFYASLYAALGSLVSRTEEMNSAAMPLSILVMLAFFAGMVALGYPDSLWTAVASYIPFFTPILMFVRVGMTDISPLAVLPPTLILLASVAGGCLLAAKIYSVGVLLYGQRPTMRAVWKAMTYR